MTEPELDQLVDDCIEQLTNGLEPDLDTLSKGLDGQQRRELMTCVEAARNLEGAIVKDSREQMSRSGIIDLSVENLDETVPFGPRRPEPELAAGQQLGDFEIVREIGRGGMGIVFEARQKSLDRRVAVKILPPGIGWNNTALERFQREARAAARLQHANIIPVYQVAEEKGVHYFAMQLIDGFPLSRLARSPLGITASGAISTTDDPDQPQSWPAQIPVPSDPRYYQFVARAMRQVAAAIDHAHRQGILHRDVKPSNLILDGNGDVWITDFGLARLNTDASVTMSGQLIGTLNYMSPEQAAGGASVGPTSDIYSLGATLYELLTLRTPFLAKTTQDLLFAIQDEDPPVPSKINPRVPADLEIIALKAMEKEPERRYETAGAVAADLQRWLDDLPIRARRSGVWRRSIKWVRRKRIVVSAAAIVIIVLVGSFWMTRTAKQKTRAVVKQSQAEGQVEEAQRLFDQGDLVAAEEGFSQASKFFSELLTGTDRFAGALSAPVELGKESLPYVYLGLIALRDQTASAQAQAVQQFDLALRAAPDNVLLKSLKILSETRDYDQVTSVIRQIEDLPADVDWGPFAADAYLAIARIVEFYDINAAIRFCTQAFEASETRRLPDALAYRGWLKSQTSRYEEAIDDLKFAFALKNEPQYLIWRAKVRAERDENSIARVDFDKAVELAPDSIEVRAERFIWMADDWGLGDRKKRQEISGPESLPGPLAAELAALESLSPQAALDHFLLARAYRAAGLDQRANESLTHAADGIPAGTMGYPAASVRAEQARQAEREGRIDDAIASYGLALEACPHREFFEQRARLHARLEHWEDALRDSREALRRDGESVSLRMARSRAFVALQRFDEATQELLHVLNSQPGHRPALELMIDIRFAQGNPSAAVELLKMLGGLYPDDPTILQRRAEARALQGDDAAARRDLELAVENGLPFPNTDAALGQMYERLRRNQQALDAYTMALAQAPDDMDAGLGRIRMLARLNRIAEALKECEAVVAANPDDLNLLMLRATFREQVRDEAGSLADWRELLRLRPNDENARWNLTRLLLYATDPSLRDPDAAASLAGSDASVTDGPSQTDHRVRAHLYFAQQQYQRSADELNRLGEHRLADWMVVSQLRARGLDVRTPDIQTEIPVNVDMSLPPWLRDLSIVWSATEGQDKEQETGWIPGGPEQ